MSSRFLDDGAADLLSFTSVSGNRDIKKRLNVLVESFPIRFHKIDVYFVSGMATSNDYWKVIRAYCCVRSPCCSLQKIWMYDGDI